MMHVFQKGLINEPYYLVLSYIKPKETLVQGMIDLEERYIPQSAIRLSDEMVRLFFCGLQRNLYSLCSESYLET